MPPPIQRQRPLGQAPQGLRNRSTVCEASLSHESKPACTWSHDGCWPRKSAEHSGRSATGRRFFRTCLDMTGRKPGRTSSWQTAPCARCCCEIRTSTWNSTHASPGRFQSTAAAPRRRQYLLGGSIRDGHSGCQSGQTPGRRSLLRGVGGGPELPLRELCCAERSTCG